MPKFALQVPGQLISGEVGGVLVLVTVLLRWIPQSSRLTMGTSKGRSYRRIGGRDRNRTSERSAAAWSTQSIE